MKMNRKKNSVLAAMLAAVLLLSGCGGAKFDPSAYTKACLDAAYHEEYAEYAEILDVSVEEAKKDMDEQNESAVERELTGIPGVTDEQKEEYLKVMLEAQKLTKYKVGEAKETDDGYEVSVTVEPIDVFEQYINAIPGKVEQAVTDGTYDEAQLLPFLIDILNESVANVSYKDETATTVQVTKDSNGAWQITEDEMTKIGNLMMPGLE